MLMTEITKFQMLAAIVKQDRFYQEFDDAKPFGDVLIEVLRKLHAYHDVSGMNVRSLADMIFNEIAEEFQYAIGTWDEYGNDVGGEADTPAPNSGSTTLADSESLVESVQATLDQARLDGIGTGSAGE